MAPKPATTPSGGRPKRLAEIRLTILNFQLSGLGRGSVLASRVRLGVQVRLDILQSAAPMGQGVRLRLALHRIVVARLQFG